MKRLNFPQLCFTVEITSVVNVSLFKTNLRPSGRRATDGDTGNSSVRE